MYLRLKRGAGLSIPLEDEPLTRLVWVSTKIRTQLPKQQLSSSFGDGVQID